MSMSVQGAAASTPWVDRSARKPATEPAPEEAKASSDAPGSGSTTPPPASSTPSGSSSGLLGTLFGGR